MVYTSTPDVAVFEVSGHTISSALRVDAHGSLIVEMTGESLKKVLRRVDSASFFRNGEEVACTPLEA